MFNKTFDEIDKADIDRLITDGVREGRSLDYKAELPKGSDGEKKEFARAASARFSKETPSKFHHARSVRIVNGPKRAP